MRTLIFLATAMVLAATAAAAAPVDFPTDRVIVRFKDASHARAKSIAQREEVAARMTARTGELMRPHRVMGDGAQVMQLFRRIPPSQLKRLAATLGDDVEILDILPDRIAFPALTPTDPRYALDQWSLGAQGINAPAAWDIHTGSTNLVIGVVDTGKLEHADLAGRYVGGYDFVSCLARPAPDGGPCPERTNDGDLRDADPTDPGDWVTPAQAAALGCPQTDSRWHGSLMAGIIAANANNGIGMAGVNWGSKVLPLRAVGKCGGYSSDIADAIRWAAGASVPGVPANTNVADVINVSLAADSPTCEPVYLTAINEAIAAGVPVIASAGNSGADAGGFSPGNCAGVITVAAVDRNGWLPSYSNFGAQVALSAPGGAGTGVDAILSTSDLGLTVALNDNEYRRTTGTSAAAAHVTGIASLMLSVRPTLTPGQVRDILANTSRAFATGTPPATFSACTGANCGQGIANAAAATFAAQAWGNAVARVTAGAHFTIVLRQDGSLLAWGDDQFGQLGDTTPGAGRSFPAAVASLQGVTRVAAGHHHGLAVRADGTLWSWGRNDDGQLGDNSIADRAIPARVGALVGVARAAAGQSHSLALADGSVWAWGENFYGQLGDSTTTTRYLPNLVPNLTNVIEVSARSVSSLALRSDNTVWAWGGGPGVPGQPAPVAGLSGITALASGDVHSVALKDDTTVWTWGQNTFGQIGNGATTTALLDPSNYPGLTTVVAIAAGHSHSLALKADGTVWAWGRNDFGQLGDGTQVQRASPVQVLGLTGVLRIAAGGDQSFAIKPDGSVWAWGSGSLGELGTGASPNAQTVPAQVAGPGGAGLLDVGVPDPTSFAPQTDVPAGSVRTSNAIAVGGISNGAAISVTGGGYSIGCNGTFVATAGTIDNGNTVCVRQTSAAGCAASTTTTLTIAGYPVKTFVVTTAACDTTPDPFAFVPQGSVAQGFVATSNTVTITGLTGPAAISISGGLYSIGCTATFLSSAGTIANGESVCVRQTAAATLDTLTSATLTVGTVSAAFDVMTSVAPGSFTATAIAGGRESALALATGGQAFAWGEDSHGQLGDGTPGGIRAVPAPVVGVSGLTRVAAGDEHGLATRGDGSIWTWGRNYSGQLGDGGVASRASPMRIEMGLAALSIAGGSEHTLAVASDFTVRAWGGNNFGQLGDGTTTQRRSPVVVANVTGATQVSAGGVYSLARLNDGSVAQWGGGVATPFTVAGLSGIVAVAAGGGHFVALKVDGTVWTWGRNDFGQLGQGTSGANAPPAPVAGLSGVVAVAAGSAHTLALKGDGTVWAWGANHLGQVGDGGQAHRLVAAQVLDITGVTRIGAGANSSYAIKPDGSVWAWGGGSRGELGSNAFPEFLLAPVRVAGPGAVGFLDVGVADPTVFAPQTDVTPGSERTSNAITVTGIANGANVTVTGGAYSVGCTATFTAAAGSINNGDSVCVRQNAAGSCATTTTTTLTIAGLGARAFSVTTAACDTTPNAFAFVPQAGVALGATVTSNTVVVSGLASTAPISIAGGAYSLGCTATFTTTPGTIANGENVCVRQVASSSPDTLTTTVLTVGTFSAAFHATTAAQGGIATIAITGGFGHTLALRSDGTLLAWGFNDDGEVGDGTRFTLRMTPVAVTGLGSVTRHAAGAYHSLAARSDGSAWAWGDNTYGQLGDGTNLQRSYPVAIVGLSTVTHVSAGESHSFARLANATVVAWGQNVFGQLGDGTTTDRVAPVPVYGLTDVEQVVASARGGLARRTDNSLWAWGDIVNSPTPVEVSFGGVPVAIVAGGAHFLALTADGSVWAMGYNDRGQLGNGSVSYSPVFMPVPGLSSITSIAAGEVHSLALRGDRTVFAWGANEYGQLGVGNQLDIAVPLRVPGITSAALLGSGWNSSFAVLVDGSLRAWGDNTDGGLGNGARSNAQTLPVQTVGPQSTGYFSLERVDSYPDPFAFAARIGVERNEVVTSARERITGLGAGVSAPISITGGTYAVNNGAFTTIAGTVSNNDEVRVRLMASNAYETTVAATLTVGVSSGDLVARSASFQVRTRRDPAATAIIPQVAAGENHTFVLTALGTVYAFGYNGNGQLGNGTTFGSSFAQGVLGLPRIRRIAAGGNHGLALTEGGQVLSWGWNGGGQLGHDDNDNSRLTFGVVTGLPEITAIAAGESHSLALDVNGQVWGWGNNKSGQVGSGSPAARHPNPVLVSGLSGVIAIAAGARHSLAIKSDNTALAWGDNAAGQLGNGNTLQQATPVAIALPVGATQLAGGTAHSFAITVDGRVFAWGSNAFGQLGDGTTTQRPTPIHITALGTNTALISGGASHSLAVRGGSVYSWGSNAKGQLGNGATSNRSTPTLVPQPNGIVAIAAGARHSAALNTARELFVWGDNEFGQVGNKSGNYNPQSATLNVLRGDARVSGVDDPSGGGGGAGGTGGSSSISISGLNAEGFVGPAAVNQSVTFDVLYKNLTQSATIANFSATLEQDTIDRGYSIVSAPCPTDIGPGATCTVTIRFAPTVPGNLSGRLLFSSSISSEQVSNFVGQAFENSVEISVFKSLTFVTFEDSPVGTPAPAQEVILFNALQPPGTNPLTVTSVSATPPFTASHTCASVAPAGSCTVNVGYTPSAAGPQSGQLTIVSNAPSSPRVFALNGRGTFAAPTTHVLTVVRAGAGSGAITGTGIACGVDCSEAYGAGTNAIVTATPNPGSALASWTGCDSVAGNECTVTMNAARSVTATFALAVSRPRDANGNGTSDVFWRDPSGQAALWLIDGTSITGSALMLGPSTGWTAEFIADFNGDGRADILWKHTSGMWAMWLLDGTNVVGSGVILGPSTGWGVTHVADFNNDGRADLLWKHTDGSVAMWLLDGLNIAGSGIVFGPGSPWTVTHTADLDGNGTADLVWRNTDGSATAWLMNGLGVTSSGFIFGAGTTWEVKHAGDFDGDGKTDLLWRDAGGQLSMFLMNGLQVTSSTLVYNGGGFEVTHVADFNGNGKSDLLFTDGAGQVAIWLMDGPAIAGSAIIFGGGGGWAVTHIGDYNGDGKADLLWKDAGGRVAIWNMDGTAPVSSALIFGGNGGWIVAP